MWLHLLERYSGIQPVFSQAKQATASVYEEFLGGASSPTTASGSSSVNA